MIITVIYSASKQLQILKFTMLNIDVDLGKKAQFEQS